MDEAPFDPSDAAVPFGDLPVISRARDFRLYDREGKRYLDFFQDGGRAVLGHRPKSLEKSLKTVIARGLYASLPSVYSPRLGKALSALFPDMESFVVFSSEEKSRSLLAELGFGLLEDPVCGTAFPTGGNEGRRCAVWRPFSEVDYSAYDALLPVLPLPGFHETGVVCLRTIGMKLDPPSISPLVIAALSRVTNDLLWAMRNGRFSGTTVPARLPGTFRLWRRSGIYLVPTYDRADHARIFHRLLAAGFLFPPAFRLPAVLPGDWSDGERKKFLKLEHEILSERVPDGKQ